MRLGLGALGDLVSFTVGLLLRRVELGVDQRTTLHGLGLRLLLALYGDHAILNGRHHLLGGDALRICTVINSTPYWASFSWSVSITSRLSSARLCITSVMALVFTASRRLPRTNSKTIRAGLSTSRAKRSGWTMC